MRSTLTEGRQSMLIGKENFPLDCSERDMLHVAIKKCPDLGKVNQKRRIAGKMETCICAYLSSFPSEVRKKFEQELGIKVTSTSDPNNQPTEAIPSGANSGQPSTECVDMTESDEEVASTDAISEPSTSGDMPGSPTPEDDQIDPLRQYW